MPPHNYMYVYASICADQCTMYFIIILAPPMANITAGVSQINQGKPLFLTCSTTGIPTPSIIWRRTNSSQPIPNTLQSRVTVS